MAGIGTSEALRVVDNTDVSIVGCLFNTGSCMQTFPYLIF